MDTGLLKIIHVIENLMLKKSNALDEFSAFNSFPGASLPCYQSLPGVKTIRPITTFDLQAIRQHMQQTWSQSGKEIANERDKLQKELLKLW